MTLAQLIKTLQDVAREVDANNFNVGYTSEDIGVINVHSIVIQKEDIIYPVLKKKEKRNFVLFRSY